MKEDAKTKEKQRVGLQSQGLEEPGRQGSRRDPRAADDTGVQ